MARLLSLPTLFSTSSARAVDDATARAIATTAMTGRRRILGATPSLRRDDELGTAVVLAPLGRTIVVDRLRGAEAARFHALWLHALADEELLHRLGPRLRQLHVVRQGAARVGVALDA